MERKISTEYSVVFLVEDEKFAFEDFLFVFSRQRACPVLKRNRVGEVFKGFEVHDFEHYGQKNNFLKLIFVIKNGSFTFYLMLTFTLENY